MVYQLLTCTCANLVTKEFVQSFTTRCLQVICAGFSILNPDYEIAKEEIRLFRKTNELWGKASKLVLLRAHES